MLVFFISAIVAYFSNSYGTVIDDTMIRNILQTNFNESIDLVNYKLLLYIFFLAVIPIYLLFKIKIEYKPLKQEIISKTVIVFSSIFLIVLLLFAFSKHYSSFFREHKRIRYYTNPTYWIYSTFHYIFHNSNQIKEIKKLGLDAKVVDNDPNDKGELVVLVVGETARADHFSLNGYKRETNPLLKKDGVISFGNLYSCGTSTAYSVPCMFSILDKTDYSYRKAQSTQNILDIVNRVGIKVLWRDNNSDSKGVAKRVLYQDFKTPKNNPVCDSECRDEGMLAKLDDFVKKNIKKDILIVLHQMGSHGPAYYKRYPKKFEKFKPVCKTNQLNECTKEQIINAYDNTILYTDYFLHKVIQFLKKYDKQKETALIYMSDHGESLGENGIYLHGLPYFLAPKEQKHVAGLLWLGSEILEDVNKTEILQKKDERYTHDNLFHTLLGIFEIKTSVYKKSMDILKSRN